MWRDAFIWNRFLCSMPDWLSNAYQLSVLAVVEREKKKKTQGFRFPAMTSEALGGSESDSVSYGLGEIKADNSVSKWQYSDQVSEPVNSRAKWSEHTGNYPCQYKWTFEYWQLRSWVSNWNYKVETTGTSSTFLAVIFKVSSVSRGRLLSRNTSTFAT